MINTLSNHLSQVNNDYSDQGLLKGVFSGVEDHSGEISLSTSFEKGFLTAPEFLFHARVFGHPSIKSVPPSFVDSEVKKFQDASLGIVTISCKQSESVEVTEGNKKHIKQKLARVLVGGRLNQCCRTPVPLKIGNEYISDSMKFIDVYKNKLVNKFSFGGLMKCGSVWICPVCASEITEVRRIELKEAVESWKSTAEHDVYMLTLTVPHYAKDSLEVVLDGITQAFRKLTNRKGFKQFSSEIGLQGRVRTLEVTYGQNGWHPHFHVLLFVDKKIDSEQLQSLKNILLSQWQSACVSSGLPIPNEHGLDLVNGAQAAAYVSKWGIEEEMTKGHLKQGKKDGHVSPFGLLDLYAEGDTMAGDKFKEFTECFKGKRQLVWSPGLREMVGLKKEKTDEEIAEQISSGSELFARVPVLTWKKIVEADRVCELLKVCESGKEAVDAWLQEIHDYDRLKMLHRSNKLRQSNFN
jgi:plasmid rolling circle replication initiator protein Rep